MKTEQDLFSLLVFEFDGKRFAVDAKAVLESVWIPELTAVDQAPPWIVGMFGLRGQIVPVIDLRLRFGHAVKPYQLSDKIIVLKIDQHSFGLVVNEILEVTEIDANAIQSCPEFDTPDRAITHLAAGVASIREDLVTRLDIGRLPKLSESVCLEETTEPSEANHELYAVTTTEAQGLLHQRAMALRQSLTEDDINYLGLAVIELSGEYFGIELTAIREFCNISQLTAIPCCPPHILGVIRLRGYLLTLIDPRATLNLPPSKTSSKAVISLLGEQPIGIAVDEVHDVVYLRNEQLHVSPSMLNEQYGTEIKGTAAYGNKTMTVLNLPALLSREDWIVDDAI